MDAQSSVGDIAPIVAFIQSFARLVLEDGFSPPPVSPEIADENAFLATRDGMDARLIDPAERRLVPVRQLLGVLLDECRPHADALGCSTELEGVDRLAESNGARRQRALLSSEASFPGVVAGLAERFSTRSARHDRSARVGRLAPVFGAGL
jgi:carboxylate-amine ligase